MKSTPAARRACSPCTAKQVDVGVELVAADRPHDLDALEPHQQPEGRLRQRVQVQLADPASPERLHRPRPLERVHLDQGVEESERCDSIGDDGGQLEAHRPADVVDDEMEAPESQLVDCRATEPPEAGPRVVEVTWALGGSEPGKIPRDPAQAPRRELAEHLAVQERRSRDAVHADHCIAVALLAYEAADPGGPELATRSAMLVDHAATAHRRPSSQHRSGCA